MLATYFRITRVDGTIIVIIAAYCGIFASNELNAFNCVTFIGGTIERFVIASRKDVTIIYNARIVVIAIDRIMVAASDWIASIRSTSIIIITAYCSGFTTLNGIARLCVARAV